MAGVQERLAVLILLLGCLYSSLAEVNCYTKDGIHQTQQQCFLDQGINITLPNYSSTDSSREMKKNYIDSLLSQKTDILCFNQQKLQTALECVLSRSIECMPMEYRGYVPQPASIKKVLAMLCSDNKVNFECVKSKASQLFDCGYRKGREIFGESGKDVSAMELLCKTFQFSAECYKTELKPCGCSTVRTYVNISIDVMYPSSCPTLDVTPVLCLGYNEQLFQENGGQRQLRLSLCFFVLVSFKSLYHLL